MEWILCYTTHKLRNKRANVCQLTNNNNNITNGNTERNYFFFLKNYEVYNGEISLNTSTYDKIFCETCRNTFSRIFCKNFKRIKPDMHVRFKAH